jgi:hypothetical protein
MNLLQGQIEAGAPFIFPPTPCFAKFCFERRPEGVAIPAGLLARAFGSWRAGSGISNNAYNPTSVSKPRKPNNDQRDGWR